MSNMQFNVIMLIYIAVYTDTQPLCKIASMHTTKTHTHIIYIYRLCIDYMYVYIHPKSILSDSKHSHPTINLCDLPAPRAELQELSRHIEAAAVVSTSIRWEKLRVTAENDGSTYGLVQ